MPFLLGGWELSELVGGDREHVLYVVDVEVDEAVDEEDLRALVVEQDQRVRDHNDEDSEDEHTWECHEEYAPPRLPLRRNAALHEPHCDVGHSKENQQPDDHLRNPISILKFVGDDGSVGYLLHGVGHEADDEDSPEHKGVGDLFLCELDRLLLAILEVDPIEEDEPEQHQEGDHVGHKEHAEEGTE